MTATKTSASRTEIDDVSGKWTDDEIEAMQEHARELKAAKRRGGDRTAQAAEGETDLLAKVAEMPPADRDMAERLHALVKANAPQLASRTWYGMPAYTKDGKVVCFFKAAAKFKTRYATFGFEETARLDDGAMWATSWALTKLTAADEAKIAALLKRAVS